MAIQDTINSIAQILKDSAEISAFCDEKYASAIKISKGENLQNPAGESLTPLLCIFGLRISEKDRERIVTISIGIQIKKDSFSNSDGVLSYDGFFEVEQLRQLVQNVLRRDARLIAPEFQSAHLPNEIFPMWNSVLDVSFKEIVSSIDSEF